MNNEKDERNKELMEVVADGNFCDFKQRVIDLPFCKNRCIIYEKALDYMCE